MDNENSPCSIKYAVLSGNTLKIIAMLSMLLDHVGLYLFPDKLAFRAIGRIAFPIFAYMIAEGCKYTRSRTKHLCGIALFALGVQIVYFVATGSYYHSILVTFTLAIALIYALDNLVKERSVPSLLIALAVFSAAVFMTLLVPLIFKNNDFRLDYGAAGVFLPTAVYFAPDKKSKLLCTLGIMTLKAAFEVPLQFFSLLSLPLLTLYSGKRGKYKLKYMFYIFYPLHIVLIILIGFLI